MINRRKLLAFFGLAPIVTVAAAKGVTMEEVEPVERIFTYRTSGAWGEGAGRALTSAEVDMNFWQLEQLMRRMDQ